MSRRTRYFLWGSALIVVVGLCTGLVAYYGGNLPRRASTIGPAELAYVPPDAIIVAHADVRSLLGSEFLQKLRQDLKDQQKDAFLAETGIDLEHDIDTVTAGFSDASVPPSHTVLLRGGFKQSLIETKATEHGATVEQYGGKRLFVLSAPAPSSSPAAPGSPAGPAAPGGPSAPGGPAPTAGQAPKGQMAVAFLEPGLMAVGEVDAVKRAIDASTNRDDVTTNAEMMKYVADVEHSGNAWVVGRFDALSKSAVLPAQIQNQIPPMQWFAVSAQVDRGISGRLLADARDDQSGEQLRAIVNGALAAAKLMTSQNPKLDAALSGIQASGTGKSVEVTFSVSPDVLDLMPGGRGH